LKHAAAVLSDAYRQGRPPRFTPELTAAYLVTRLPATFAAALAVCRETAARLPSTPRTLLDLGAGTAAASLAAAECFPLQAITLLESEPAMIDAGRTLLPHGCWQLRALPGDSELPPHDLVIAAYLLSELSRADALRLAERAWQAARQAVLFIEPGSPRGFTLICEIRAWLLQRGACMLAPCPGDQPCPMPPDDWCHFAARVERSSLHRKLKDASLSYEDEKFSYVALSRQQALPCGARIVRRPEHQPRRILLTLCQGDAIRTQAILHRERSTYKTARQAHWGDAWLPGRC
jgi:ribosomal protein RSM22 (predicted rRNA methylase)